MPANSHSGFSSEIASLTPIEFVEKDAVQIGERPNHVITMVHGIRDPGILALDIRYYSQKYGLNVLIQPVSYGWLGALRFLFRIGANKIEKEVKQQLIDIFERYPEATHSIFAHSNGTKIISRILNETNFKYRNIFFCGSVCICKEGPTAPKYAHTVVNDCSPRDTWPLLAETINPFQYEASGTYGFCRPGIEDRFFTVAHGGCLTTKHFEEFIIPTILSNSLRLGEKPRSLIPYGTPIYIRISFAILLIATLWIMITAQVGAYEVFVLTLQQ